MLFTGRLVHDQHKQHHRQYEASPLSLSCSSLLAISGWDFLLGSFEGKGGRSQGNAVWTEPLPTFPVVPNGWVVSAENRQIRP